MVAPTEAGEIEVFAIDFLSFVVDDCISHIESAPLSIVKLS